MPKLTISEDKARILAQLKCNLDNMPDSDEECEALFPQMSAQLMGIIPMVGPEDCRPAELQALLSLFGPILARTPTFPAPGLRKARPLRAV